MCGFVGFYSKDIKDENVIKLCDEYGIAMVFTSTRHFRH